MIGWRTLIWAGAAFLLLYLATPRDAEAEPERRWNDKAEVAFVQTGGNTAVTTLAGKNELNYLFSDRWKGVWNAAMLYGETDGEETAKRYATDLRLDYIYSETIYIYGLTGWLQDQFAGFDQRYYVGPGAGYHFVKGPRHFLSAELGANWAREEYIDDTESDFLEGRAFGKYELVFNDKVTFSQRVEYLHNFRNGDKYKVISETALEAEITQRFSVKAAYEVRYDNAPTPATLNTTDTLLSVALVANL